MNSSQIINNFDLDIISLNIPTPFSVGTVNVYLLMGEKITLVDTGPKTDLAWKTFIYQLNQRGLRIKDIDQVLITHHHVDHSGLSAILKQHHPELKTIAHVDSVPWLEQRSESIEKMSLFLEELYYQNGLSKQHIDDIRQHHEYFNQYFEPVRVDMVIHEETTLPGNEDWTILHAPGHSQGHVALFNQEAETLISGDHLICNIYSGSFIEPAYHSVHKRTKSMVDHKYSLERLKTMKISQVFTGHGKMITNINHAIDQQLLRIEQRSEKIKLLMGKQELTVYEMMKLLYPNNRLEKNLPMIFSEVVGILDLLESQGLVKASLSNQVIKYRINE